MKKFFRSILVFVLSMVCAGCTWLLGGCGSTDNADAGTAGLDYYQLDDGTYGVRIGTMTELSSITIGSTYSKKKVTTILESGFAGGKLKSITIPSTIVTIRENAFMGCESLEEITIPDSVTFIGKSAFNGCKGLKSVVIGNGVTSLDKTMFGGCNMLRKITIGNGITSIGESVFKGCGSLNHVIFGGNVTKIGKEAFQGCGLKEIIFPDSLKSIGAFAFQGCNLEELTIPQGINEIGVSAFKDCTSLKTVFWNATDCTLSAGWGGSCFENCKSLTKVAFGDEVEKIPNNTLSGCSAVTNITIPKNVKSIGDYAFNRCIALKNVYYSGSKSEWEKVAIGKGNTPIEMANIYYQADQSMLDYELQFAEAQGGGYVLTKVVQTSDRPVTSVKIPEVYGNENVISINNGACWGCRNLVSITIPKSIIYIGDRAFNYCDSLKDIYYEGTKAEWTAISKAITWNWGIKNSIVHCSDGDLKATVTD